MFAAPDLCVVWISAHAGLQLDGERSRTQNVVTVDDYGRPVFFFVSKNRSAWNGKRE